MVTPIVSPNSRIRHPDLFQIGEGSIVDDYCYFSTQVRIGRYSHIASNCTIAGGRAQVFELGDFSSISAGARIWCTSDDYVNDLVTIIPLGIEGIKEHLMTGGVSIAHMTAIGANAVIMPLNDIPEGVSIGALSFVPFQHNFEPWMVYAGIPIRPIAKRNRDAVLRQRDEFERQLQLRNMGQ